MRIVLAMIVGSAALCLGGCAAPNAEPVNQVHKRTRIFDPDEYRQFDLPGTGVIEGQAFLLTRGGDVKHGAGKEVTLRPKTMYSTEEQLMRFTVGMAIEKPDPRESKYIRKTKADAFGNFRFERLPAGEYYLSCPIFWETLNRFTGGMAVGEAAVSDGQVVKVNVTR
jgi:hypothetical protein